MSEILETSNQTNSEAIPSAISSQALAFGVTPSDPQDGPTVGLFGQAKMRARRKGLPFNIDISDIVIPETCPLLGVPLVHGYKKHHANSPSIDRLKPELGYVKGNIAIVSYRANSIKQNATPAELRMIAEKLEGLLGLSVH